MSDNTCKNIKTLRLSKDEKESILKEQSNLCVCCGKPLADQKYNVDHIMPRVIYKWIEQSLKPCEQSELRKLTLSTDNVAIVHERCNVSKSSVIPRVKDIDKLHTSDNRKNKYKNTITKCEKYITKFKRMKTRIYNKQNRECFVCGRKIGYDFSIIRRINDNELRTERNAVLVCGKCNACVRDIRRKR